MATHTPDYFLWFYRAPYICNYLRLLGILVRQMHPYQTVGLLSPAILDPEHFLLLPRERWLLLMARYIAAYNPQTSSLTHYHGLGHTNAARAAGIICGDTTLQIAHPNWDLFLSVQRCFHALYPGHSTWARAFFLDVIRTIVGMRAKVTPDVRREEYADCMRWCRHSALFRQQRLVEQHYFGWIALCIRRYRYHQRLGFTRFDRHVNRMKLLRPFAQMQLAKLFDGTAGEQSLQQLFYSPRDKHGNRVRDDVLQHVLGFIDDALVVSVM